MNYLIAYDIKNNKSRTKVASLLEGYGYRVNYSVFECVLTPTKLKKIISDLEQYLDKSQDSIRFYHICKNCLPKSFELCKSREIFQDDDFYI